MAGSASSTRRRKTTWGSSGAARATSAAHPEWARKPSATRAPVLTSSERDPHAELDVAGRRGHGDLPEAARAHVQRLGAEPQVRLVEDVEEVGLELQLDVASEREALAQRDVPDLEARPPELAAPDVSAPAFGGGGERRRVEPVHDARGDVEHLRLGDVGVAAPEIRAPRSARRGPLDRDRRARLIAPDAADLPAAEHAPHALLVLEEREPPGPGAD